ncbi:MAG: Small subunit (SSU) processome component [Trizodia sp. TS-e1964]|nr:MAG: Small subunit (SSU) processome component [Trizodia sp. TS-e1964]
MPKLKAVVAEAGMAKRKKLDESHTVVLDGSALTAGLAQLKQSGGADDQKAPSEASVDSEDAEEPTLGDLVRASHPEPIDVEATFPPTAGSAALSGNNLPNPNAGSSLGAVLNQAVKTNDAELLETCLRVREKPVILNTIQRLEPELTTQLLFKLANMLHGRPGRAETLLMWIEYIFLARGVQIDPDMGTYTEIQAVKEALNTRARSLIPLLALKGKLDILSSHMAMRKAMKPPGRAETNAMAEEKVIFVEGSKDSEQEHADDSMSPPTPKSEIGSEHSLPKTKSAFEDDDGEDDDDEMPTTQALDDLASEKEDEEMEGLDDDGEEGVEDDEEDDADVYDGLIDDEAEETEAQETDEMDEDGAEYNHQPTSDAITSDEEEARKPKRQATGSR